MERPLAHLLPEMTSNILAPVCILIYLFVLDWRMALLSLVSIPVGMAFMMAVMANYGNNMKGCQGYAGDELYHRRIYRWY